MGTEKPQNATDVQGSAKPVQQSAKLQYCDHEFRHNEQKQFICQKCGISRHQAFMAMPCANPSCGHPRSDHKEPCMHAGKKYHCTGFRERRAEYIDANPGVC